MKKAILLVAIAVAWGTFSFADFPGSPIGGGGGSSLPDQTGNNGKVLTTDGSTASWGAAGSGTVTGPATATGDHFSSWGADNTTLKDSGYGAADFAPASSTSTATDWNKWDGGSTGLTAATGRTSLGLSSTDNVTFSTVTASGFISSATDNTRGVTVPNTADPTTTNLALGKLWYNTTSSMVKVRNADNTATQEVFTSGASHTLNFATTGTLSGAIPVLDNVSGPSAAQMYGSLNLVNAAITVTLPTAVAGMSGCVLDSGTAHDIIVDVQAGDNVILVGVVGAGGVGITNASGATLGDYVCVIATAANKWTVMGKQGTWASQ